MSATGTIEYAEYLAALSRARAEGAAQEREACIRDIDAAFERDLDISAQDVIRARGEAPKFCPKCGDGFVDGECPNVSVHADARAPKCATCGGAGLRGFGVPGAGPCPDCAPRPACQKDAECVLPRLHDGDCRFAPKPDARELALKALREVLFGPYVNKVHPGTESICRDAIDALEGK